MDQIEAVSFEGNTVDVVTRRAVDLLNREMTSSRRGDTLPVKRGLYLLETAVTKFLTVIGVLRAWDFLKNVINLG